ncbi:MAG: transposase [Vulcanibacillus sp.]
MARQARKESITNYYHVMLRGINREYIFNTEDQKRKILELIKREEKNNLIGIVAWCIMDNHVHLLLKAKIDDMSKAIKIISLKYAAYYNKSKKRIGPVFGDRYRSENIEDDKYMLGVIRYIHNNPIKSKIIINKEVYEWSSYKCFIDNNSNHIIEEHKAFILGFFNNKIINFEEFHNQEDVYEYLEIKEDREKYRQREGQKIITEYLKEKGIIDAKELKNNPKWICELVEELSDKTKLTLRQIARLTDLTLGMTYEIIKKNTK